ncbi:uncharacterized protein EI97DRAFT_215556 [Westerdykella ornata]|uniref:Uncharacterized protein n=1 Tax=Westerdykella ornata TaxID=318751 RepID=A0A6A6JQU0_WESOR|nr:uncharacterized protein EI97DRAFT_215556 [Westerdykella ornata]KAF2278635.1 hypothetical protein EI97DRAFT_215556 [Westerdykella ornata]
MRSFTLKYNGLKWICSFAHRVRVSIIYFLGFLSTLVRAHNSYQPSAHAVRARSGVMPQDTKFRLTTCRPQRHAKTDPKDLRRQNA